MKKHNYPLIAVYLIFVSVISLCTYKITYKLLDYHSTTATYNSLADRYTQINPSSNTNPVPQNVLQVPVTAPLQDQEISNEEALPFEQPNEKNITTIPDALTDDGSFPIEVIFEELLKENDEIVGWIYLPETKIDYPVVCGSDNDYYLHRNIHGDYSYAGTIFLDASNYKDWSSRNNILYGHNMNDGSMFHSIIKYKDQKTYDKQPYLYLATPDGNYRLDIFAGFITESESDAYCTIFTEQESFVSWYQKMESRSTIAANISPNPDSRIVMLSTCTYERENMRYVLMMIMRPYI